MMNSTQYTLFVGDLSIFCTEEDLKELFEQYGELAEVKIIRCEETKKNLSYGFVKYVETDAAVKANEELNGTMLCGRPLRVNWASRRTKNDQMMFPPFSQSLERSSVHVTYTSNQIDTVVTEEYFVDIFSKYGTVIDAAVKRFEINEELHSQKGYGFVHFAYTPEGVAAAVKCCDELHDSTLNQVQYKCSISHRLRQCMNGGVSEEPQHSHYHGHHNHHHQHSAQRHQQRDDPQQLSDFGYPPAMLMNPPAMPTGAYPMQYGYNQAGMMVPMNVSMDTFPYANNPYWSQVVNNSAYTGVQAGQPMPFAFPSPYAQQYPPMANAPYYMPQQSGQYYNEQAPSGVYTMPYTWGYPYQNTTEEEIEMYSQQDTDYDVHPSPQEQIQHQAFSHYESPQMQQTNQAAHISAAISAPVMAPSATSPTTTPTNNPGVVTGFGAQQRPTASEMAAAVHGSASFTYIPCGVPTTAGYTNHDGSRDTGMDNTPPSGVQGQHPHPKFHNSQQQQQTQQQSQQKGAHGPSSTVHNVKGAGGDQHHANQRTNPNPYAPRPKTWTDLFQAAVKEAHKQPVVASAVPVPPVVVPALPLQRNAVPSASNPDKQGQGQGQSNKRPFTGPVHYRNNHQQQHHHHPQYQRGSIVKSASTGSLSGSLSGSTTGTGSTSGSSTGSNSTPKPDTATRTKDLPVMVVGTGTSTGHSILVSSLRSHRDYKNFTRNVNLCTIVPRQRGPAVTPRTTPSTEPNVMRDGIAACHADSPGADAKDAAKDAAKDTTDTRKADCAAATAATVKCLPDLAASLSPTHEDTSLDSVAVRVTSPGKILPYVARGGEGRLDMM